MSNTTRHKRRSIILTALTLLLPLSANAIVVNFPDPNLEAAVREEIGKPTGDILDTDLVGTGFTLLSAVGDGIVDLTGLEYCTDLTDLNLYSNQISDISALAGLTNLTNLRLGSNQISDVSALSGLTNLSSLSLYNNQISDLSALSGLINLSNLKLANNQISDVSALSGLTKLGILDLNNNQIGDISALSGLTNMQYLELNDNQISDVSALSGFTDLRRLWLNTNEISDIGALSGLTYLTSLDIDSNQIIDLSPLTGLTTFLESLSFDNNQISDLSPLTGLTNLMILNIQSNQISDISALVANPGIGFFDYVDLRDNSLNQDALCNDIPTLEDRFVNVDYDGVCVGVLEIIQQPVGGSAYVGGVFALTLAAYGGVVPLYYQWRFDGSDIDGATRTDLVIDPVGLGDAGGYDCFVHDLVTDSVTSDVATLAVAEHLVITTHPQGAELNLGDPYTLYVETNGGFLPLTYQWNHEGSVLPGATASAYEIVSFGVGDIGTYTLNVNDNHTDEETSNLALLTTPGLPVAGAAGLAAAVLAAGLLGARRLRQRKK